MSLLSRPARFAAVIAAGLALAYGPARAQLNPALWVTDGNINSIVCDGNTIYIAGAIVLWWHKGQRPQIGSGQLNVPTAAVTTPAAAKP